MPASLASALRQEMEGRELTMAEAAAEMGVTQPTVSRWLRGTPPDVGRIQALAGFLSVSEAQVEELVMRARRDQLERRRAELAETIDEPIELSAHGGDLEALRQEDPEGYELVMQQARLLLKRARDRRAS